VALHDVRQLHVAQGFAHEIGGLQHLLGRQLLIGERYGYLVCHFCMLQSYPI
jgi:hypothetical protein